MNHPMSKSADPVHRFTNRVVDYARFRPGYPQALLGWVQQALELQPPAVVADLGSGTGCLSDLFLRAGFEVLGVEPNAAMREAGARALSHQPRFCSLAGRAEATGLAPGSVDLVAAGQAFHWFEPVATAAECRRILRPGGSALLVWNERRRDAPALMREYQGLLCSHAREPDLVREPHDSRASISGFFGAHRWRQARFEHRQRLDYAGLCGRAFSSSYAPAADDPQAEHLRIALAALFRRHQDSGYVELVYETRAYLGRPANPLQ